MSAKVLTDQESIEGCIQDVRILHECGYEQQPCLIMNADDWGRDHNTTNRINDCGVHKAISSVSAMVFMEDSERAAEIARSNKADAGLHLNLTLAYSSDSYPAKLLEHQQRIARTLTRHRFAFALYYPWLVRSFEYVVKMQIEEFTRLYGKAPVRIDGHHHMHLCANVLRQRLLPGGIIVRRNLSFRKGEKNGLNRMYRSRQDACLLQRHEMTDFFFDLQPVESLARLKDICELAAQASVEVETHPVNDEEYRFLMNRGMEKLSTGIKVACGYALHSTRQNHSAVGLHRSVC